MDNSIAHLPNLSDIQAPVRNELKQTRDLIFNQLLSDVPLIETITQHIFSEQGKGLRPLLVLLSAKATGHLPDTPEHLELAAIIEFVHTATLLHDDVIDASTLRRGKQTAHTLWGGSSSILVGDFLYSRAFQILAERSHPEIMRCLSHTTNCIAEGEIQQLANQHDTTIDTDGYFNVIYKKTAKLFESSAEIGAILSESNTEIRAGLAAYGKALGLCFQVIDDLLDYTGSADTIGKAAGDDLADGKMTLPLIIALQTAPAHDRDTIHSAITSADRSTLPDICAILNREQAIEQSRAIALDFATQAESHLAIVPSSPAKTALIALTQFALHRGH